MRGGFFFGQGTPLKEFGAVWATSRTFMVPAIPKTPLKSYQINYSTTHPTKNTSHTHKTKAPSALNANSPPSTRSRATFLSLYNTPNPIHPPHLHAILLFVVNTSPSHRAQGQRPTALQRRRRASPPNQKRRQCPPTPPHHHATPPPPPRRSLAPARRRSTPKSANF